MRISRFILCLMAGAAFGLAACGDKEDSAQAEAARVEALEVRIAGLEQRKTLIEDGKLLIG